MALRFLASILRVLLSDARLGYAKRALRENLVDPLILLGFQETGIQAARSVECG
jgi:hypothetical protein